MANLQRNVFLISDSTGITLENLSHSLLTQFPQVDFTIITHRYIDSKLKIEALRDRILQASRQDPLQPLVFTSLLNESHRRLLTVTGVHYFDVFDFFMDKLNQALELAPVPVSGLSHGVVDEHQYESRIDAINFSLRSDDGMHTDQYSKADVIIIGVSRTGKTPTCLYLAMHYGILAANYPLTEDDWKKSEIPEVVTHFKNKCFGLTIDANQLARIRSKRLTGSDYASVEQCRRELSYANNLFSENNIPCLNTSTTSIEELATSIISKKELTDKK
jgi:regulator of PEP synthase PpsR (kinase-PPPase family)